ncbi:Isoflavone 2'-hydroxylase [Platanthera zijinensis]|uniref:Isoflavone 2'-hydroxylase n=1 Tax=Platanthera zijinensis TaxID=2320716 RepID=A0AAP0AX87_9ASPA
MEMISLVLGLSLLFFLLPLYTFRRCRHRHPGNYSPPSPLALPLLGHLHLLKKPLHRSLAGLSAVHGPILSLRFGSRPVLHVASASAAEECLSKNDAAFGNRPRFLAGKHLGYDYTTLVWAPYGPHWRNLRRIAAVEFFSSSRLDSFSSLMNQEAAAMVKAVDAAASGAAGVVELRPRLFDLSLNLILKMVAGKRPTGRAEELREIIRESFELSGATNLADFIPALRLFDYKGLERRLIRLQGKRDDFMQELVDDRRREVGLPENIIIEGAGGELNGGRRCVIDELLSLQRRDPAQYTDELIKGIVGVLLTAGTDTSALTAEWALAMLLRYPASLAKVRAEIDRHVGSNRRMNESDLENLPYLRSVIKETLRLHPVAALIPAHESSADCIVGGFHVPRGVILLVNAWAIHRDPALWAAPESFRPERWEEEEDEGMRRRQGSVLFFGMGRRKCPGEGMALRVVGLALGLLVQCFEWDVDALGGEVDLTEGTGLSMPMATPLKAACRRRQVMMNGIR